MTITFSESLFKTMKYRGYMGKRQYRSLEDAKVKLHEFVKKYNEQWVHSGINNVTPESRFKGLDNCIQAHRQLVLLQALERNPNRWIGGKVRKFSMATSQFLNPDRPSKEVDASEVSHLKEGATHNKEKTVHWPIAA